MTRTIALGLAALLALAAGDAAAEISGNVVRIGVLNLFGSHSPPLAA